MNFTQETIGGLLILRMSGQLMGGPDSDSLRETIRAALEKGTRLIILDMHGISWVNSAGLGILISSHLAARQAGGSLRFINLTKRISSILSVTRLATVFEIFPSEQEARTAPPAPASSRPLS